MINAYPLLKSHIILLCYYIVWHFILKGARKQWIKLPCLFLFGFFLMLLIQYVLPEEVLYGDLPMMMAGIVWIGWRVRQIRMN